MTIDSDYDAVVVGAGPNGLAAALTLAEAGRSVLVLEASETIGGGTRSAELTLPGFIHDVCAATHPLALASPFFRTLALERYGLKWIHPPAPLAHPMDDGTAIVLERSVEETAQALGEGRSHYRRLMRPFVDDWERIIEDTLGPIRRPRHPLALARFGLQAFRSARGLAQTRLEGERARALFSGLAGHSMMPLEKPLTAAFGLMLGMLAHAAGWPLAQGGSQRLADALARHLKSLGGRIETHSMVSSLSELPPARTILMDVTPRQLLAIAGDQLPTAYREQLARYRYGPGVSKVDWALDGPIPWKAGSCARAGTLHLGGSLEEIASAERAVWMGEHPEKPFVLVGQQSLFDASRAPQGKHTAWAYCHVPNGSVFDMTERIESQLERFAPGFRDRVLARSTLSAIEMEAYNPNYIGGDIGGGVHDLRQLLARPVARLMPYTTPIKGLFLCSASTPPGAGVHGMCGYFAAQAALRGQPAIR